MNRYTAFVVAGLCFLISVFVATHGYAQSRISDIRVIGTQRIEPATVISYMGISTGEPLTDENLDEALKNLYRTGLFADIVVRRFDNTVEVSVEENPVINSVVFEGNDKIKDEELKAEIQLRERQVFTRSKVQSDLQRLYQLYQRNGRFSVVIDPKIIKLDQNRVNLVFEIEENEVSKVRSIEFIGNRRYSDSSLKEEISTKESRWYKILFANDRYDPDRINYDQELLRRFYLGQGYVDFRVLSANAELSRNDGDFYVTFTVEEGQRYKTGKITIDSAIKKVDTQKLYSEVTLEEGDWYDANKASTSVDNIIAALGEQQFAFVNVRSRLDRDVENAVVDVVFEIEESPRVFVERININGNVRTLDKVIRREIELVEGDPFIKSKLADSERNIRNLNYFSGVDMKVSRGSAPDKSVVNVSVEEKSTGELSLGAGYSTADGALADFRLSERNLLGKGQDLSLGVTVAGKRTEYDISFTEPYFMNRDLALGFDLFHVTQDLQSEASYDQRRSGGGVRMAYPLAENWRQSLGYRYEKNVIRNVKNTASTYIKEQVGSRRTSSVSHRIDYDDRDSRIFPTEGLWAWLDTEFAGLGGDAKYVSGKLGSSWYYPVYEKVVFNLLGEVGAIAGWGDEDVAINERYYLGGVNLRGFESAGIGPRDTTTDDALGGNMFYRGTAELSFPIGLPDELGVQGHAFNDIGSLWDVDSATGAGIVDENAVRASGGLGLSWRSPMGPIRIDYAVPYMSESYDNEQKFRFSFGTRF